MFLFLFHRYFGCCCRNIGGWSIRQRRATPDHIFRMIDDILIDCVLFVLSKYPCGIPIVIFSCIYLSSYNIILKIWSGSPSFDIIIYFLVIDCPMMCMVYSLLYILVRFLVIDALKTIILDLNCNIPMQICFYFYFIIIFVVLVVILEGGQNVKGGQ